MGGSAYTLHAEDDDFGQAGTVVHEVFGDPERDALVETVAGALLDGVRSLALERAFAYLKRVDPDVRQRIEATVRRSNVAEPVAGMGER